MQEGEKLKPHGDQYGLATILFLEHPPESQNLQNDAQLMAGKQQQLAIIFFVQTLNLTYILAFRENMK